MIGPDWPLKGVGAFSTTRAGGVSEGAWASLNLGAACGDKPEAVAENRRRIQSRLPGAPHWLRQVHGHRVIHLDDWRPDIEADAAWSDRPGQVLVVQTADCLPVLLTDRRTTVVAAAHAGWRGLVSGVLPRVIEALPVPAGDLMAWIGPSIAQAAFEVGPEVRAALIDTDADLAAHFRRGRGDRWLADLQAIASAQLHRAGVDQVSDCGLCTFSDPGRFFSFRRDRVCGRMATLIWMD